MVKYVQSTHFDLESKIVKDFSQTGIYKLFKSLKDKSEDVRYFPHVAKISRNDRQFCEYRFQELEKIKQKLKVN